MQRKFLERIKVSVARMQCLVDDLVQMAVLDSASVEPLDTEMNLAAVIDQAVAYTSSQMREKNINLELVIPSHLPLFKADGDALEQVLIHLLQNASMVTPNEGTVRLSATLQPENGERGAIRLQVTDNGGGIHPDDLQRVFSRLYRSVNIPIPGVGDTGVGLTIAKTLMEAMGGRIWVESQMGKSAIFHVMLPVDQLDPQAPVNPGGKS
jgi:histidine kinase